MLVAHITTIPRSYRVSTKNGWKSVLLRRVNRINPNWLQLKHLIPIKHDLDVVISVVCHSPCKGYWNASLTLQVMDSPVPLMHHDPQRSWITDPDPDHPKRTQPNTYESWKIRFANTPARVHVDLPKSQIKSWS